MQNLSLSLLPLSIVVLAILALILVAAFRASASTPGPIVSYPLIMADRRVRSFNKRLGYTTRRFQSHE